LAFPGSILQKKDVGGRFARSDLRRLNQDLQDKKSRPGNQEINGMNAIKAFPGSILQKKDFQSITMVESSNGTINIRIGIT